jgi:O-antigen ligase
MELLTPLQNNSRSRTLANFEIAALIVFPVVISLLAFGIGSEKGTIVLGLLTTVVVIGFMVIKPRIGVFALVALLPFHMVFKKFITNEIIASYWKEALVAFIFGTIIIHRFLHLKTKGITSTLWQNGLLPVFIIYFGFILLRFVFTSDHYIGMWGIYFYFTYTVVFLAIMCFFQLSHAETMLTVISIMGGFLGFLVMFDAIFDLSPYAFELEKQWYLEDYDFRRARFPFSSPLPASAFLSVTAAITYGFLISTYTTARKKTVLFLFFSLNIVGLILTFTRGGWLGFIFSVTAISALQTYPRIKLFNKKIVLTGIAVVIVVLAAVSWFNLTDALIARFASTLDVDEGGNQGRIFSWVLSINEFLSSPIYGIGVGMTGSRTRDLTNDAFVTESYLLQHLVEMGILGFIAFIAFYLSIIRFGLRLLSRSHDIRERFFITTITGILISLFLYCSFLQVLQMREISMLFWLLVGILVSINKNGKVYYGRQA